MDILKKDESNNQIVAGTSTTSRDIASFIELNSLIGLNDKDDRGTHLDVIIPVYNAYDDFIKCLKSVFAHRSMYRVILINDKSTDPRIGELFEWLVSKGCGWLDIIENEENLGFVKSVNRGMRLSRSDVILLNSDTIVTSDWTEKMRACAYSDDSIATVTPFTNNGTICSIPNFCEDNRIPEGFTLDTFAEYVDYVSFCEYPEIPTAVGFCMFIKRSILDKFGYFDEESYGKGYGEENDFCMRIIRKGYRNVLCDNVYIYHRHSASFSQINYGLKDKNAQILYERYPEYLPSIQKFCTANPLRMLHDNIRSRMTFWDTSRSRKSILYILHHTGGGTEKNTNDIINGLSNRYIFYILQVVEDKIILTEINNGRRLKYIFKVPYIINPLSYKFNNYQYYDKEYNAVLRQILNTFKIDIIHIQHMIGHKMDIISIAKEMHIPVMITLHDYFVVCPRIHLVDYKGAYCGDKSDISKCRQCLSKSLGLSDNYIVDWRKNFGNLLDTCDRIIFPTVSVLTTIDTFYRIPEAKKFVVGHGQELEHVSIKTGCASKKFSIAFIGGLSEIKGSKIFYSLAASDEFKDMTEWSIIGASDIHSEPGFYQDHNIYVSGVFKNFNDLKNISNRREIDLVIFPGICPETYSYTLTEAWALGIPVLVSNLGALKERVEQTGGGWVASSSDVDSFKSIIEHIIRSPEEYLQKANTVKNIQFRTIGEMARDYVEKYENMIGNSRPVYDKKYVLSNRALYGSMEGNAQYQISETTIHNKMSSMVDRFIICIKQNGYIYTVKRVILFISNKLFMRT